ncbi:AraC family transcriptional regulator [Brachybacterium sp. FME24]|uniref:AraC family transcriptional regulator n=1 Tax=Brachybacterium sp. FME24 TaxID=2742605 RepID=UPI001867D9A8|nr:AraC family transcriptional regulator [Brachybacterium sp. FME24]
MILNQVAEATAFVDLVGLLESGEVDGFDVDFLSWGFYEPSYWRNYAHTHSYFEVCLAYSGQGTFTLGEATHPVSSGDVFIARPGDVHEIVSSRTSPLGIAFWGFTLQQSAATATSRRGWWTGLVSADRPDVSTSLEGLPELVVALAAEASAPRSGHQNVLAALGAALVVRTGRAFASADDLAIDVVSTDRTTSTVAAMERYLSDNLGRTISVRDVAAVVHLSTRHAERLFAQQTGSSLMAALRRLRLERAAHLLLETEDPVAHVARACGYPEARAFITAFRRHYGQPPGSFRSHGGTLHL